MVLRPTPPRALALAPEVAAALAAGAPVVALESTLISHGLPWPTNLEAARAIEADVRAEGAVPATVAIIDGRLRAGLGAQELEALARAGPTLAKASRRDLPLLLAEGGNGATTVAATMIVAAAAGIRIFATGGIGGVHRGAAHSFDVSADLAELARSPVAVVCAGAKAILDLPATRELLETLGVPVIGFGTDEWPAFWSRGSGLAVDRRLDTPAAVARVLQTKWSAGLAGGVLVAQPIPAEHALPRECVEAAVAQALAQADGAGIRGSALTPFLLARVVEATGGASLQANVALVRANARLAARIAAALAATGDAPKRA